MGKQGFDSRTALANALNTSGKAKAAPPKKELVKEPVAVPKKKVEKGPVVIDEGPKSKKELEEDQRRYMEQKEAEKKQFFAAEEARKLAGAKGADEEVTYVEDKDTRKPKAVSDISDYWKKDLGLLPYMPTDNVQELEVPEDLDVSLRLLYLQTLNEQLEKLLRMRFHVFWSQCIFDPSVSRLVDSYLRFCLRSHDFPEGQSEAPVSMEEMTVSKEVSRRMFQLLVRLSRPQESGHEFLTHDKFAQVIHEHQLFDVPKIIDICVIYGDANRNAVTKIVHSVFKHQPLFKEEFTSVVQHMLDGLLQCCAPLQLAARGGKLKHEELSVSECKTFLPDMLSCFNAIFCFFPEDCVEKLMGGSLKVESASNEAGLAVPLADLMVILHDAISALRDQDDDPAMDGIIKLLTRLLSCVLGFRMAPRHGADAFGDLVAWVTEHAERTQLIQDLSRNGLDNVAMEWIASSLVDDAQLDYLDDLCGAPLLPKEARHRRGAAPQRPRPQPRPAEGTSASPSQPSQPSQPSASSSTSTNDRAKIREVREVVGSDYGEGFILQCLLHYGGSVPQAVGGILDGSLPPQITALPIGMSIGGESMSSAPQAPAPSLSAEDKQLILKQADSVVDAAEGDEEGGPERYNDDYDDEEIGMPKFNAGVTSDWEDRSEEEDQGSSDGEGEGPRWSNDRMRGGRLKGKGKGKGRSSGPTQGQTVQARRKEANKAQVANHNRRDAAMRKMARGL